MIEFENLFIKQIIILFQFYIFWKILKEVL